MADQLLAFDQQRYERNKDALSVNLSALSTSDVVPTTIQNIEATGWYVDISDRVLAALQSSTVQEYIVNNQELLKEGLYDEFIYFLSRFEELFYQLIEHSGNNGLDFNYTFFKFIIWGFKYNDFLHFIMYASLKTYGRNEIINQVENLLSKSPHPIPRFIETLSYLTHQNSFEIPFDAIEILLDQSNEDLETFRTVFEYYFNRMSHNLNRFMDSGEIDARVEMIRKIYTLSYTEGIGIGGLKKFSLILMGYVNNYVFINQMNYKIGTDGFERFRNAILFALEHTHNDDSTGFVMDLLEGDNSFYYTNRFNRDESIDLVRCMEIAQNIEGCIKRNELESFFGDDFNNIFTGYKDALLIGIEIVLRNNPDTFEKFMQVFLNNIHLTEITEVQNKVVLDIIRNESYTLEERLNLFSFIIIIIFDTSADFDYSINILHDLEVKDADKLKQINFLTSLFAILPQEGLSANEILSLYDDYLKVIGIKERQSHFDRKEVQSYFIDMICIYKIDKRIYTELIAKLQGYELNEAITIINRFRRLVELKSIDKNEVLMLIQENEISKVVNQNITWDKLVGMLVNIESTWEQVTSLSTKYPFSIENNVNLKDILIYIINFEKFACDELLLMFLSIKIPIIKTFLELSDITSIDQIKEIIDRIASQFLINDATTYLPNNELYKHIMNALMHVDNTSYQNGVSSLLEKEQETPKVLPHGFKTPIPIYLPEADNRVISILNGVPEAEKESELSESEIEDIKDDQKVLANIHERLHPITDVLRLLSEASPEDDIYRLVFDINRVYRYTNATNYIKKEIDNKLKSKSLEIKEALSDKYNGQKILDEILIFLAREYTLAQTTYKNRLRKEVSIEGRKEKRKQHDDLKAKVNDILKLFRTFAITQIILRKIVETNQPFTGFADIDYSAATLFSTEALTRVLSHDILEHTLGDRLLDRNGLKTTQINKDDPEEIDAFISKTFGLDASNLTIDEKHAFLRVLNFQGESDVIGELRKKYKQTRTGRLVEYWVIPSLNFWKNVAGTIGDACYQGRLDDEDHVIAHTIASGKALREAILTKYPNKRRLIRSGDNIVIDDNVQISGNYLIIHDHFFNNKRPVAIMRATNVGEIISSRHIPTDTIEGLLKVTKKQSRINHPKGIAAIVCDAPHRASTNETVTYEGILKTVRDNNMPAISVDPIQTIVNDYTIQGYVYAMRSKSDTV